MTENTPTPPMPADRATLDMRCPRCGYDQRGAMTTWKEQCPLQGTCTECGLAFHWAELIRPHRFEPPWCVEFARPWRRVPRATAATFLRCLWPWGFWRAMKMSQAVRPGRLALFGLWLVILLGLAYAIEQSVAAIAVRHHAQQMMVRYQQVATKQLRRQANLLQRSQQAGNVNPEMEAALQLLQQRIQARTAGKAAISLSYLAAVREAVFLPLASTSSGTMTLPGRGASPYCPPRQLHLALSEHTGLNLVDVLETAIPLILVGAIAHTMMPGAFVLLPVSRRRAKVRWGHILRVGVYGLSIPAVVVCLAVLLLTSCYVFDGLQSPALSLLRLVAAAGIPALTIGWWAVATGRYLRIPHGWAVASLLTVLCGLLLLTVVVVAGRLASGS